MPADVSVALAELGAIHLLLWGRKLPSSQEILITEPPPLLGMSSPLEMLMTEFRRCLENVAIAEFRYYGSAMMREMFTWISEVAA